MNMLGIKVRGRRTETNEESLAAQIQRRQSLEAVRITFKRFCYLEKRFLVQIIPKATKYQLIFLKPPSFMSKVTIPQCQRQSEEALHGLKSFTSDVGLSMNKSCEWYCLFLFAVQPFKFVFQQDCNNFHQIQMMNSSNYRANMQGHRIGSASNRDLAQKLTYQQLLNLNHDLSKENLQLKNIGNRLGNQLRALHNQFQIKPRDENVELYTAINVHPILHQYELTLIPLLDAYQAKIQEFQNGFETINDEFITLEKKYEEVTSENERLRAQLTDKIVELIDVYKKDSSEKLGSDFGQIILQQINEKQKFLANENSRLDREYQRYKSQSQKNGKELAQCKRKLDECIQKYRKVEASHDQMQQQVKYLKENIFNVQMKVNEVESEKRKINDELERALSQVNLLTKDREGLLKSLDQLKFQYEKNVQPQPSYQDRQASDIKAKNFAQDASQPSNDDSYKKLAKLQKQFDSLLKEKNKLKEQLEQSRVALEETTQRLGELKKNFQIISHEKSALEMSEMKAKKMLNQLNEKAKVDIDSAKREQQQQIKRIEDDYFAKIEAKIKKISEIEDVLDKVKLERDRLEQENIIHTTLNQQNRQTGKNKDSDRAVEKLKEKLAINEELFKEQIHIMENDNIYLKKEAEKYKAENKEKSDQLRRIKQELQKNKKDLIEATEQKAILIEEIKRVRNEYEGSLRDKERLFDQKIKQIKYVVEEFDKRRKMDKQKVAEASRQYKRVLEQIKNAYEERIRILETESASYSNKSKKIQNY